MTDSLRDDATRREFDLRKAMGKARFAIELNPGLDMIEEITCEFRAAVIASAHPSRAILRFPSLTLMTLVGHAITSYRDYWDTFWEVVGVERSPDIEAALRHSLSDLLQRCGLDPMVGHVNDHQYVMAVAAHAGIPMQSVDGLLTSLEDYARAGHDLDAPSFIEWLTDATVEHRMNRLDLPVQTFISRGETLAVNVIDRIIDLAKFTLEQPDVWHEVPLDTTTTGVPDVILTQILARFAERPFMSASGPAAAMSVVRPAKLRYSVEDNQIVVELPYPITEPHVPWQVSSAKVTVDVVAQRGWGAQAGQHPPTPAPVTEVSAEIGVAHEPTQTRKRFELFTSHEPYVLFTEGGRWLKAGGTLPRGPVFVLIPQDAEILDSETDVPIESTRPAFSPNGWRGWRIHTLNLAGHDGLFVRRAGSKETVVHTEPEGTAEFYFEGAVSGLRTVTGRTVYSERPVVDFPPGPSEEPQTWLVGTRRVGEIEWTECEWESGDELTSIDPFDGIPAPLLGEFEVRVQRGASVLTCRLFIAEGVEFEYGELRVPESGGLSNSVVSIYSEDPLTASPGLLAFGPTERDATIRLSDGDRTFDAVVRPPAAELRVDRVGHPADWRVIPAALTVKDVEERHVIAIRVPDANAVTFEVLTLDGEVRWTGNGKQKTAGVFSTNSERFRDAVTALDDAKIVAHVTLSDGSHVTVAVCNVSAVKRVEAVTIVDGTLLFDGLADVEDPAAWIWSMTAPWRPVQHVDIHGDIAELPEELVDAGGVIVDVFSNDPFGIPTEPSRPGRGAVIVEHDGWVHEDDPVLDELSAYLADIGTLPSVDSAMPQVWAALKILPTETSDQLKTRAGLLSLIGHDPRAALEALGSSSLNETEHVSMLIETSLVDKSFAATITENPLHLNPWIGSLVEISDLPSLRERADEVLEERAETIAYLAKQGGAPLIDLLRTGNLEHPLDGTFDKYAPVFDVMPAAQMESFIEASRLVPGGMLERDSRVKVLLDDFGNRGKWSRSPACENLNVIPLLTTIRRKHSEVADLVVARNEALDGVDTGECRWATVPMISMTLAIAARLTAHRMAYHLVTAEIRDAWVTMASLFPGLVATDLLIAEAAVSHAKYGDLIGDVR
ncbi:hypothetical protein [Gordonia liuliyuniae]|uniref:Uncharacterized protein n=1 Tax=Gordonia liuliyuniae TaxID=2911517 RepID=A0ABS9IY44_9ACTN|nr:hypothetical protein [Gordonia liuliyuniae]MCF8590382.1 hypothetical protein [Gordonia liuliyuniae]